MRNALCTIGLLATALFLPRQGPSPGAVVKLEERQVTLVATGTRARVDRPYFDSAGHLQWDGSPMASRPGDCPAGTVESQRSVRLLEPRVDEVLCAPQAAAGGQPTSSILVGLGSKGEVRWQRALGFQSGKFSLDEQIIGATPAGLVLSNLTVVSPRTGTTLLPPPAHPVGPERRPVPDYALTQSAIYLPGERTFVLFDADVTMIRRTGGLYWLNPRQGKRDLLLAVSTTLLGGYWRVEDMALGEDGRSLFLAQKLAARGPGGILFTLFDLKGRKTIFQERFGEGHFCRDPKLVVGAQGNVGLSYLDETTGEAVLVHYRVSQLHR